MDDRRKQFKEGKLKARRKDENVALDGDSQEAHVEENANRIISNREAMVQGEDSTRVEADESFHGFKSQETNEERPGASLSCLSRRSEQRSTNANSSEQGNVDAHAGRNYCVFCRDEDEVVVERDESSIEDPRSRPGAHAIHGNAESPSSESSEHPSPEPDSLITQPDAFWIVQSAQLVDEAAEEQRRLEFEQERQRNLELETRIRDIENEAVVAIPISYFAQDTRKRRWLVGVPLALVVAAIVGIVLSVVLANGGDDQTSLTTGPLHWNQMGQTLHGEEAGDSFGLFVALSSNGTILAAGGTGHELMTGHVRVFSYESVSNSWNQLGQNLDGTAVVDNFGVSVALSWDGEVVAAGAPLGAGRKGYIRMHSFNSETGRWMQVGQKIEGRAVDDWFGSSVAMSADGSVVAAGGSGRDWNDMEYNGDKTGYVRAFALDSNSSLWTPMGQDLNGTEIGDAFGRSVALSADGTILAVGADWADSNSLTDAGRVQVFEFDRSADRWEQMGQDLVGEEAYDYSGWAVALSEDGTVLAVGAVWNNGSNGTLSGHVRVFSYNHFDDRWNQMGQDIDGESEYNNFGHSVALSADGMIVAAGANLNDGRGGENSGHVRVFSYDSRTEHWNQVAEDMDGDGEGDMFGAYLALSGNGTIVAAGSDGNGPGSGHVRVFKLGPGPGPGPDRPPAPAGNSTGLTASPTYDNSTWSQLGQTLDSKAADDQFGWSVALSASGTVLAGGGPSNYAGHVRVFSHEPDSGQWKQLGQDLNGKAEEEYFGYSVALSWDGTVLAAGAINCDDQRGCIRVFIFNSESGQWSQMGADMCGWDPGDLFGTSVALSADGAIAAAGGPGRSFDEFQYDGNKTGYARVWAFNSTSSQWTPMGQFFNGNEIGDAFGGSVALSGNGKVVAVGGAVLSQGCVQVFEYNITINRWKQIGQDLVGMSSIDSFGHALDLSEDGTILAVGAWRNRINGHVRVFSYDRKINRWHQIGQEIDGELSGDGFGFSVALSTDGMTVAAGAPFNDGKGGEDSGHVRVFSYDSPSNLWTQLGEDLDGKGNDDGFGWSMALSRDGTIVAGGAIDTDSGYIQVFEVPKSSN